MKEHGKYGKVLRAISRPEKAIEIERKKSWHLKTSRKVLEIDFGFVVGTLHKRVLSEHI